MLEKYDKAVSLFLKNTELNECTEDTITGYARICRLYREYLAQNGYEEASMEASLAWRQSLEDRSAVTVDLYMRVIQYLSDFAVDMNIYSDRFMSKKLFPKRKQVSKERNKEYEHLLSEDDVRELLSATRANFGRTSHTFVREKALVGMALLTGARNIELRNLTVADLDWNNSVIYARVTKGGKPRMLPFPEMLQNLVYAYLSSGIRPVNLTNDETLFGRVSREGVWTPYEREYTSIMIHNYVRSVLGEEKAVYSHALRHSFASLALSCSMDIASISTVLGHSDIRTTKIYAKHLHPEKLAADFGNQMVALMQRKEESA